MDKSFHNTTNLHPLDLIGSEAKARNQEQRVLKLFMSARTAMSPDFVWMKTGLFDQDVPLTSVRRAMTNLCNAGLLVKGSKKTMGRWGKPQFTWAYKDFIQEDNQTDFLK